MNLQLHYSLFGKMYFNEKNPRNYKYLKSNKNFHSRGFSIHLMTTIFKVKTMCFVSRSYYISVYFWVHDHFIPSILFNK